MTTADGTTYTITSVRDLYTGFDSSTADNVAVLPPSSDQMITFTLDNGIVFTLRTSGTEPKFKYYFETCGRPEGGEAKVSDDVKPMTNPDQREVKAIVKAVIDDFIQPEMNKLVPKA